MKTYLVTGGAGFIGSNFIKYLLDVHPVGEIRIVVADCLTYAGNLMNISVELESQDVCFIKADIRDSAAMKDVFACYDPDYVVNFAAETHVDRSITDPRIFLETNILGTHCLLECARLSWSMPGGGFREGKRFLQISTDEVYGSLSRDFDVPEELALSSEVRSVATGRTDMIVSYGKEFFTEATPLSPRSPYSAAKASADMIVMAYHDTYGLPVNITRCSNNYGPYQFPEKLIPLVINNILHGKKLPVYGRGINVRDWLYVEDHASAIETVLREGRDGEIYNIGGFNEKQNIDIVKEIIDAIAAIMHSEPQYRQLLHCPAGEIDYGLITYVTDRPGHDMRYAIDPTKIVTELGWYPRTPFKEGIIRTVRWYLDNREWFEDVTSGGYMKYYEEMYSNR